MKTLTTPSEPLLFTIVTLLAEIMQWICLTVGCHCSLQTL